LVLFFKKELLSFQLQVRDMSSMSATQQDSAAQDSASVPRAKPLPLQMTQAEAQVFTNYCSAARSYLEFGAGGSTVVAAQTVKKQVITVDSDAVWLERVRTTCAALGSRLTPATHLADIGATKEWGYPADATHRADWPRYHESVWDVPGANRADLYLIDGRFRVACLLQILLRAPGEATILFHHYASRPHYHVIEPFVRVLGQTEELAAFKRHRRFSREKAALALQQARFDAR